MNLLFSISNHVCVSRLLLLMLACWWCTLLVLAFLSELPVTFTMRMLLAFMNVMLIPCITWLPKRLVYVLHCWRVHWLNLVCKYCIFMCIPILNGMLLVVLGHAVRALVVLGHAVRATGVIVKKRPARILYWSVE